MTCQPYCSTSGQRRKTETKMAQPIRAFRCSSMIHLLFGILIAAYNRLFGQGSFDRPATFQAPENRLVVHASSSAPFSESKGFPIKSNSAVIPAVVVLLDPSSPSTVAWLIVAKSIDSIKSQANRAFAHVCKKVLELVPSLANSNTSLTIFKIRRTGFVETATHHARPDVVGSGVALSVGCISIDTDLPFLFDVPAPAGGGTSIPKALGADLAFLPAVAFTQEQCAAKFVRSVAPNNDETAKTLSSQVNKWRHELIMPCVANGVNI